LFLNSLERLRSVVKPDSRIGNWLLANVEFNIGLIRSEREEAQPMPFVLFWISGVAVVSGIWSLMLGRQAHEMLRKHNDRHDVQPSYPLLGGHPEP